MKRMLVSSENHNKKKSRKKKVNFFTLVELPDIMAQIYPFLDSESLHSLAGCTSRFFHGDSSSILYLELYKKLRGMYYGEKITKKEIGVAITSSKKQYFSLHDTSMKKAHDLIEWVSGELKKDEPNNPGHMKTSSSDEEANLINKIIYEFSYIEPLSKGFMTIFIFSQLFISCIKR